MSGYTQADRPLRVSTPLGEDVLLLVGFAGREAISEPFAFQLDCLVWNDTPVPFDKLLGQRIAVSLAMTGGAERYFQGICSRVSQRERDEDFTAFRLEMVPPLWLLGRRAASRIFQHIAVPDILKKVFDGLDASFDIQGTFHPRDYCVQYRETDLAFASRLMEEEGIYYFFNHTEDGVKMVVANQPFSHPPLPEDSKLIFESALGGPREEDRVLSWEKSQELRPGRVTLWDHTFEMPDKHLEATRAIADSVQAGKVTHKLKLGANDKLEVYDYPGGYAQRFDGIDRGGGERPQDLQKIFEDNQRTANLRMQELAAQSLLIDGTSTCRQITSGHKFTLTRHFNGDGDYAVTAVDHQATCSPDYRSDQGGVYTYENHFACMPLAQPFRPPRRTPKPTVQGTQTAVVVGPPGEEIFCDKYGRVKVQFHWDRDGKYDADSSCWCRVSTFWGGKGFGVLHIPLVGMEVIVDFLEGDPDQPIIIGSVYNADAMPPYKLPENKTISGMKSRGKTNTITHEDKAGEEYILIKAQKDLNLNVTEQWKELVTKDKNVRCQANHLELISKNMLHRVEGNRNEYVVDTYTLGARVIHLKASLICLEADEIRQVVDEDNFVLIKKGEGVTIKGATVYINCGGSTASPGKVPDLGDLGPDTPIGG